MFIGEYSHSIDPKKRLAVPIKFRSELKNKVVVTRGLDKCLWWLGGGCESKAKVIQNPWNVVYQLGLKKS